MSNSDFEQSSNDTVSVSVVHTELRCPSKKHGELLDHMIEVKCSSKFCGASSEVVVIHRFDSKSGDLVGTKRYRSINLGA